MIDINAQNARFAISDSLRRKFWIVQDAVFYNNERTCFHNLTKCNNALQRRYNVKGILLTGYLSKNESYNIYFLIDLVVKFPDFLEDNLA